MAARARRLRHSVRVPDCVAWGTGSQAHRRTAPTGASALAQQERSLQNPARIRVSTTVGVVKPEGTVRDEKQRTMAMELARSVRSVSTVSDELRAGTD
nr:BON domain-containing protein [Cupriavidus lacunae]